MLAVERAQPVRFSLSPTPEAYRLPFESREPILAGPSTLLSTPGPSAPSPTRRLPPSRTDKKFICDWEACDKAYNKPARLAEHRLSHTGERPHQCPHCPQAYLRATHLNAHLRTHLSDEDRPFACLREGCGKKFWTATHLRRHEAVHDQVQLYKCEHCEKRFTKAHMLRDHLVLEHMPPGTKPYPCAHPGCDQSFATRQHLHAHAKIHDPSRYTCSHSSHETMPSFPNWSALQTHMHEAHPPQCPYPECHGRIFKSAHRLKDHLKTHTERDQDRNAESTAAEMTEDEAVASRKRKLGAGDEDDHEDGRKLKRLKNGNAGKEFACEHPDCSKRFKSKHALKTHVSATHSAHRPHHCPREGCDKMFRHKTSLDRHVATHDLPVKLEPEPPKAVGVTRNKSALRHGCPISRIQAEVGCGERYNRVYDVRRHLKSAHDIELDDAAVRKLLEA